MSSFTSNNNYKKYMSLAIKNALYGEGFVHPNPLVGAVIVKDDTVLAQGYHHKYGEAHAERDAINNAKSNNIDISGSTIYVTLEPCCHQGKQPPCTQAIIDAGIKKVVIGSRDPNPLVDGKGVKQLLASGIEVEQDIMREECDDINRIFFHYIQNKKPYVILKYAMTADGLTAASSGKSKWISNEESRKNVHLTRANVMAVLTGVNTVISDNPQFTCRLDDGKSHHNPVRVIADTNLRLPEDCTLVQTAKETPVIVAVREDLNTEQEQKLKNLSQKGVTFVRIPACKNGHIELSKLLDSLGQMNIDSVLAEGGGALNGSLLFDKGTGKTLVNEIHTYIAPKVFGNTTDKIYAPVRGAGIDDPSQCIRLSAPVITVYGEDVMLKYFVKEDD